MPGILAWLLTIGTPAASISSRRCTSKLVTPMCRIFDPFTCHPCHQDMRVSEAERTSRAAFGSQNLLCDVLDSRHRRGPTS